jgi:hypothetical protein
MSASRRLARGSYHPSPRRPVVCITGRRVRSVRPSDAIPVADLRSAPPPPPDLLRKAGRLGPCLLCGGRPQYLDVWVPGPAASLRLMDPSDQSRPIVFALCEACASSPGLLARVEGRILADVEKAKGETPLN